MGRKIKKLGFLIIIMILIYFQQSVIYARGEEKTGEMKKLEKYQLLLPEPDGMSGYYTRVPTIQLTHADQQGATLYELWAENEAVKQGRLEHIGESVIFDAGALKEGRNVLHVFMENEQGERLEYFDESRVLFLDSEGPEISVEMPDDGQWQQDQAVLHVESADSLSGVDTVLCYVDGTCTAESESGTADFVIRPTKKNGAATEVRIIGVDRAGNLNEVTKHLRIDDTRPESFIEGVSDYAITGEAVVVTCRAADACKLQNYHLQITRERPDGSVNEWEPTEWESSETSAVQIQSFAEDGLYRLKLTASDDAGHSSEKEIQFIIDVTDPVVRKVEELAGKQMQEFVWNYPPDHYIQDFTSYTYQILLDGRIYPVGEIVRTEGRHKLQVEVVDAAGNRAVAEAEFLIDRGTKASHSVGEEHPRSSRMSVTEDTSISKESKTGTKKNLKEPEVDRVENVEKKSVEGTRHWKVMLLSLAVTGVITLIALLKWRMPGNH